MNVRLNHVIRNWGFPGSSINRIYAWAAYLIVRFPIFSPQRRWKWLPLTIGQALDLTALGGVLNAEV